MNININHIGVQQMIKHNRPFALLLAAAMVVGLWVPTLTLPAQAYAAVQLV